MRSPRSDSPGLTIAASCASNPAWVRLAQPSLTSIRDTYPLTVASDRYSRLAIWAFDSPSPRQPNTSASRSVSVPTSLRACSRAGWLSVDAATSSRGEHGMPVRRYPHQPDQVGRRRRLDEEPGRAGAQGAEHILVGVEGGQHDHDGRVGELADPLDRGEAVYAGHAQVHEHQIGLAADDGLDPGRSVVSLVHDLDVTRRAENRAQVRADHRLVVDDDYPDHAGRAAEAD